MFSNIPIERCVGTQRVSAGALVRAELFEVENVASNVTPPLREALFYYPWATLGATKHWMECY